MRLLMRLPLVTLGLREDMECYGWNLRNADPD
jgi:hypothetical protein